jgi:5'-deoxynucleotidase YfbR-like HD superfamily hydrolase
MKITTEREFITAARERSRLDECVLRENGGLGELRALEQAMDEYDSRVHPHRGPWMPVGEATRFWAHESRPGDFDIADIARGLAHINRFNGRIRFDHYSVAQHSLLVADLLPPELKLFGLMHDAAEAFLGDLITPVKRLVPRFAHIEDRAMRAIALQFGFVDVYDDPDAVAAVKRADTVMLATEARDVSHLGFVAQRLTELPRPEPIRVGWAPAVAERAFLAAFEEFARG